MVNPVIVSHSSRLGEGVGELARQMLMVIVVKSPLPRELTIHIIPLVPMPSK